MLTFQRVFMVIVLVNVIMLGCSGSRHNSADGENSAISDELEDDNDSLEVIIREELLWQTNPFTSSNEINKGNFSEEARKKGGKGESMMNQILPILIIPFLISSSMIPAMLLSIKFLMIKSAMIGKVAIILMLLNFFRGRAQQTGGVTDHYPQELAQEHYGYHGVEEPGVYVNKRKRKKRQLLR